MAETKGQLPDTLNGWKEIALFLGKSVRSVQRWERDLSLPVRRINTPDQGQIVYASRSEIEEWRRKLDRRAAGAHEVPLAPPPPEEPEDQRFDTPVPPPAPARVLPVAELGTSTWRPLRAALLLTVVALALVAGVFIGRWMERRGSRTVHHIELSGTAIEAVSASGQVVWTHQLGQLISLPPDAEVLQSDLENDGAVEFIVPVRTGPLNTRRPARSDRVFCFRSDGTLAWSVDPDRTLHAGERVFKGPWHYRAAVSPGASWGGRTWIGFNHHVWSPSFVSEVAPGGAETLRYVQSGWVTAMVPWDSSRGPLLAIGGVSNEHERASIAFIDIHAPPAQFSEPGVPPIECENCPRGRPMRYALLPSSEILEASGHAYTLVTQLSQHDGVLRFETGDGQIGLIGPGLDVTELTFTDSHWAQHRSLEATGRLMHAAEKCPQWSKSRAVRLWSDGAWHSVEVNPAAIK